MGVQVLPVEPHDDGGTDGLDAAHVLGRVGTRSGWRHRHPTDGKQAQARVSTAP